MYATIEIPLIAEASVNNLCFMDNSHSLNIGRLKLRLSEVATVTKTVLDASINSVIEIVYTAFVINGGEKAFGAI